MQLPLISVAIPAYNVEKYIEECLNSVLNQTFQNWECIIVNDGSTDNTLSIIENFVAKDNRFSCYTITNSGSAKVPRDKAISYAKADWVIAVDADDFIDNNVLEKLYARAMQTKADIVYPRMKFFSTENSKELKVLPNKDFNMQRVLTGSEAVMLTIPEWVIGANGEFVKKKLWDARSTLNSGLKHINIDEYDTREMLIKANVVAFENVIYHYRVYSSSITHKITPKFFETLITDKMLENLFFEHFGKNSLQSLAVSKYRMEQIIAKRVFLFRMSLKLSPSERKEIKKKIKEHYMDIDRKIFYAKCYTLFEITSFCRFAIGASLRFLKRFFNIFS